MEGTKEENICRTAGAQRKSEVRHRRAYSRNYKDNLFRMVFRERSNLLSLYNAVNGTDYKNSEELEIVTLENAIYMNMKNDVAFVLYDLLNLYEHQSTFNPNMPLRNLFYISREYEKLVDNKSLYFSSKLPLPTPRFVVFYNGTEEQPESCILKLSDLYRIPEENPELELRVRMLNINLGSNEALLQQCRLLKEYMLYVDRVRSYAAGMPIAEAVERSVAECIKEGILAEFLTKYRREAIQMSIFEYDEEKELRLIRQDEREQGLNQGLNQGREQVSVLIQKLIAASRTEEIERAVSDQEYQNKLFLEFGL